MNIPYNKLCAMQCNINYFCTCYYYVPHSVVLIAHLCKCYCSVCSSVYMLSLNFERNIFSSMYLLCIYLYVLICPLIMFW